MKTNWNRRLELIHVYDQTIECGWLLKKKKFDLPVDNENFYYCAEFSKQKENDSYKTLNDNF